MAEFRYITAVTTIDEYSQPVADTVYVADDDTPERTGLLDATGTPLYRVVTRIPFGFRGRNG